MPERDVSPIDLQFRIETPENVILTYSLAGPCVRLAAFVVDQFVKQGLTLGLMLIFSLSVGSFLPEVSVGFWLVLSFLMDWGYHGFSEGFFRGRTVGKRLFSLRVIQEQGYPISLWSAVLRNMLRSVDSFPLYGAGWLTMLCSGQFRRLGDLAARTIVIEERTLSLPHEPMILERIQPLPRETLGTYVPTSHTLSLIEHFLGRRHVLTHQRGHQMAQVLARALAVRLDYTGNQAQVEEYPMAFLARVYVTYFQSPGSERAAAAGAAVAPVRPVVPVVKKAQFLLRRKPVWQTFERLVQRLDAGKFKRLLPSEVSEFSRLFREICFDLALIRSRDWGNDIAEYLNGLVVRGHGCFHQTPPHRLAGVVWFLRAGFPRLLRANARYFALAAALFFIPLGLSWALIQHDQTLAELVIDAPTRHTMEEMYSTPDPQNSAEEVSKFGLERSTMAGFYVKNNIGIAWQCFAHGCLCGVGTVYMLLFNGIFIGAVAGYLVATGHGERFLSFIVSHGSFELTAIAVAGAGGLMLADALIRPGQRPRLESLRVRGPQALQMAAGAGVMLGIAALIEAFWSPAPIPVAAKYVAGVALWLIVIIYLGFAGSERTGDSKA